MSKILQNTTGSPVVLADVGVTVPASGNFTIPPTDYLLFAASSNTITQVGNGTLTVNDGTNTLSIANGTSLLQGLFPTNIVDNAPQGSSSYPDPSSVSGVDMPLNQDAFGNLQIRGTVLTDEGSVRDDFSGSSLTTALTGTLSFVNGNTAVTGSGTTFTTQVKVGQYVKVTSQTEAEYTQVATVVSDTSLTLAQGYLGATASGVASVVSNWETTTASGTGSITVSNSTVILASGVTSGQSCNIIRIGDYLPYSFQSYTSISQRIANQTAIIGFVDTFPTPNKQVVVQFTGTTNTTVNFVTASSTAAADTQTTAVTLPNGGTTSSLHLYRIDLSQNQATLSIDGAIVATNTIHLPGPYDNLQIIENITNTATAGSSTTLTTDYVFFQNIDRVQIDHDFMGEPMPVAVMDKNGSGTITSASGPTGEVVANTDGSSDVTANITGTWVATLQIEATSDGINWFSTSAFPQPSGAALTNTTTNQALTINCGSFMFVRIRASAYTSGTASVAWNAGLGTNISTVNFPSAQQVSPTDGQKATYSATSAIAFASATTATDIFTITGSASKTVRVLRMAFSGTQTTAAAVNVLVIKRSAANSGGTSASATIAPHDSNDAAGTATVLNYTANATSLGASVGTIRAVRAFIPTTALASASQYYEFDFGNLPEKAIVLRGTTQVLALSLNSTTISGGAWTCFVEWTEE